ncbi:MAG: isoprenyl transferase [Candidatus Omnitrophota bacterium]
MKPPDDTAVPAHIAIIMDGNGRWAQEKRLPKIMGHRKGAEAIRDVLKACGEFGVRYLTLYAFSTENWKRPPEEVEGLMKLLVDQLRAETKNLNKNNVRLNAIGRLSELSHGVREQLRASMELTSSNTGVTLTLALNYGGRAEIIDAVRDIARETVAGRLRPEAIDDAMITGRLSTAGLPDPDLLIRTSGEMRISNFLLWQLSYAEIYFTPVMWPDFGRDELARAIAEFGRRQRRYGA